MFFINFFLIVQYQCPFISNALEILKAIESLRFNRTIQTILTIQNAGVYAEFSA